MTASRYGVLRAGLVLTIGILALGGFLGLLSGGLAPEGQAPQEEPVAIRFQTTAFEELEGWPSDDLAGVMDAFLRSCEMPPEMAENSAWLARPWGGGSHLLPGGEPVAGRMADWAGICSAAADLPAETSRIRRFMEDNFTPVAVLAASGHAGLFTGYYEPHMTGSRTPTSERAVPLLAKPDDLISIDLGDFRDELKGKRLAGRVIDGALKPYKDRAAIEAEKNASGTRPLVWIDDPVDAFFLHIQGSGRVTLDTGETVRVGYAGQNGHPYVAIGKVLLERGAMTLEEISMQSIRAWLTSHASEAAQVMAANTSYVFFREIDVSDPALGPLGAGGVSLTPWRSLAVDRRFHALGVPVWLETSLPGDPGAQAGETQGGEIGAADVLTGALLQRLMVAQDTGGAITGAVRGDVFFGWGEEAEDLAGRMKSQGRITLLLPNAVAARLPSDKTA